MTDDVRPRVVAVAVAHRRPVGVERLHLGRALRIDDRLEQLVRHADRLGRAARLLRMLGRDDRDRLAEVAHTIDREDGLVGELEPVRLPARHVRVGQHRVHAGHRDRGCEMSISTMRACACGLRSVCPQSMSAACRSLAYANSPFTFGVPSERGTLSPIRPSVACRGGAFVLGLVVLTRPPSVERSAHSWHKGASQVSVLSR